MNTSWNLAYSRQLRLKQLLIRGAIAAAVLLVVGYGVAKTSYHYIRNLPRERDVLAAPPFEQFEAGVALAAAALKNELTAAEPPRRETKLDRISLFISGERIDQLNAKLPESGRDYKSGWVRIDGRTRRARLRYRGDSIRHWAFPARSWRIKMARGGDIRGRENANLYLPRSREMIAEVLGYQMAEWMGGFISPKAHHVSFTLNRKFDGVRIFLEQVDQDFLYARGLPAGRIFEGDITAEDIYTGLEPRRRLFADARAWTVDQPAGQALSQDSKRARDELQALNWTLDGRRTQQLRNTRLPDLLDTAALARMLAYLDIVVTDHLNDTHNQKLYLDPRNGVLRPLLWDPLPYLNREMMSQELDIISNQLFKAALSVPEIREAKNHALWQAINGPLSTERLLAEIDQHKQALERDVAASPHRLQSLGLELRFYSFEDWKRNIGMLKEEISSRNQFIKDRLSQLTASAHLETRSATESLLTIAVSGDASFIPQGIRISGFKDALPLTVRKESGKVVSSAPALQSDGSRLLTFHSSGEESVLHAGRVFAGNRFFRVPELHRFLVTHPQGYSLTQGAVLSVEGRNSITGTPVKLDAVSSAPPQIDPAITARIPAPRPEDSVADPRIIRWSGTVEVPETLLIRDGDILEIAPGTTVRMAPGVSVVAQRTVVRAQGTASRPIRFVRADPTAPWGVFAINRSPQAELRHLHLHGGSVSQYRGAVYPGALSTVDSVVTIESLQISDGALALSGGNGSASSVLVRELIQDPGSQIQVARADTSQRVQEPLAQAAKSTFAGEYLPSETLQLLTVPHKGKPERELEKALKHLRKISPGVVIEPIKDPLSCRDILFASAEPSPQSLLRHCFEEARSHELHLIQPDRPRFWPISAEIIARRIDLSGSPVEWSFPLSERNPFFQTPRPPGPAAPWSLAGLLPILKNTQYFGIPIPPIAEAQRLRPQLVMVSERHAWRVTGAPVLANEVPVELSVVETSLYPWNTYQEWITRAPTEGKKGTPAPAESLWELASSPVNAQLRTESGELPLLRSIAERLTKDGYLVDPEEDRFSVAGRMTQPKQSAEPG